MDRYLAKSNPEETIQEHTDKLVENYKEFKGIYPEVNINWDILYKAVIFHDLGKINEKFQRKIKSNIRKVKGEIPHGILSLPFIDYTELENSGYSEDDIKILYHSVGYHHDRKLDFTKDELESEIKNLRIQAAKFKYDKIENLTIENEIEPDYFQSNHRITMENGDIFYKYILMKGLLNRLDYAASASIPVEIENNFLIEKLEKLGYEWNELQEYMKNKSDENLVVVAQTGMGKTEAGLLWIGDNKGFFTLPLKTAINVMYDRVVKIVGENNSSKVGLLHSETYKEYMDRVNEGVENYLIRTKQLSLPLTICTLDQLFDLVYRYPGFEQKLATLSYSKVVIDEIQMYSPDLLAYLIVGLSYITKIGGKFAILTATLPSFILDFLKKEEIEFTIPKKPFIDNSMKRHSVRTIDKDINIEEVLEKYNKNKVLVICNTVRKAQELYEGLVNLLNTEEVQLFHSKFTRYDRKNKEESIFEFGQSKGKKDDEGIWITTQVVEASLDIDFDVLITELSDLNGLFQRMGRCYRKRNFEKEGYNCFVYYGKGISGIKKIVDEDIFILSRDRLKSMDGFLLEEEKMKMIDEVYSREKIKGTKYYEKVRQTIKYVKSFSDYCLTKSEARDRFRNIISWNIIPENIYLENKLEIDDLMHIVNDFKNNNIEIRYKAKIEILNYSVSINEYDYEDYAVIGELEISKYEKVYIYKCKYSKKMGFQKIKKEEIEEEKERESNII